MHLRFVDILTILQKEILRMEPGSKISQAIGLPVVRRIKEHVQKSRLGKLLQSTFDFSNNPKGRVPRALPVGIYERDIGPEEQDESLTAEVIYVC
jgi:hypothetical protein